MRVVAIDPGVSGGIACIDGSNAQVQPIPTRKVQVNGKNKTEIDAMRLADLLRPLMTAGTVVVIERVTARPNQGSVSTFGFGRSLGMIEGVCGCLGVSPEYLRPQEWKATYPALSGLTKKEAKDKARKEAARIYPNLAPNFKRVKDDGLAESILMAHHRERRGNN
jgi:crossover junction endodeoxyribonuclease RuvC